ncbi:MAG: Hint domain-containing protein [Pirellulaceae bacterium]
MKYDVRFKQYGQYVTSEAGNVFDGIRPPELAQHECFAAGTKVQTSRGTKPIESVLPGDAVLSKDLESGELFWDMVIATTNQPPKQTFEVKTDSETFQCTGGHLFWVSGKGWTKARELLPGDTLHGVSEPARVASCSSIDNQPTFNLVTEKAHNYFVGTGKLLTHDFEEPEPTAIRVPGLANLLR